MLRSESYEMTLFVCLKIKVDRLRTRGVFSVLERLYDSCKKDLAECLAITDSHLRREGC
jgi:hypothetical protein